MSWLFVMLMIIRISGIKYQHLLPEIKSYDILIIT